MCAIAGFVGLAFDEMIVNNMLSTMKNRGPDDQGYYKQGITCLLHTRLAVIDLEGGKQPMHLQFGSERYTIVYNGELYNTNEIRNELKSKGHIFCSHSDTEVILHAYAQWGEACVDHFNGIFAFAIWEEHAKRLFLARDRMGVKPLFYKEHETGFIFASEIKTMLSHPSVSAKLDASGVAEIILLGPGRTPGCGVFKNIKELEPGCCGYFSNGHWKWRRYWRLTDKEHTDNFEDTAAYVRYLVTDAIKRQMVSDVPIGTFLSGGLDSSIITSICAKHTSAHNDRLPTFSVDYENNEKYFVAGKFQPNSDNSFIQVMQEYLGTEHQWTVLTPEDLINSLQAATIARDIPGMADVDFSLLVFCGHIRQKVKVALSGECADEIFGGYPWYRDPEIRSKNGFPWAQNTAQRATFLAPDIAAQLCPEEYVQDRYEQTLRECDILPGVSDTERRMKQMVNLNHRWFMQTLLDRKDRMSMYHGLEVRVPFCDYRIAEYLYSVPWEFKNYQNREKGLLRYATADLLPDAIAWRKKSPYPKTHDPRYLELVRKLLQGVIQQKNAPIFQIIDRKALEALISAEYTWPWYGQLMRVPQTIAYMLQINFWLSKYKIEVI